MNKDFRTRLVLIAFFLGLNIVLGSVFLKETKISVPTKITPLLQKLQLVPKDGDPSSDVLPLSNNANQDPDTLESEILDGLNQFRFENDRGSLERNSTLDAIAQTLAEQESTGVYLTDEQAQSQLDDLLEQNEYLYLAISHNSVVGPTTTSGFMQAILGHNQQSELLLQDNYTEIGITLVIGNGEKKEGTLVYLLAEPYKKRSQKLKSITPDSMQQSSIKQTFPFISNTDVLLALNQYRADHHVHALVEEAHLCNYAEKRVGDQISFGGLDAHAGFKSDFENDQIPAQLEGYQGTTIGENLAYQHCKNMQTDDSFIAQTAAALIEWCFDSSTKGHREAQLNSAYNNVCVRNKDGYFVVIFGE